MEAAYPKRRGIFFGWWIALTGMVMWAANGAFSYYGFSAFFTPLIQQFGWSRTELSGAISFSRLQGGVMAPLAGYLVDRFGTQKLMAFGVVVTGLGYILLARVDSLLWFYFVFVVLVQGGSSFGMGNPVMVAVANWFRRKRGQAMGIVTMGLSFGGMVVPLLAWLISTHGWQTAAVVAGITIWVLGLPLSLVVRHRPEPYGYLPDGEPAPSATVSTEAAASAKPETAPEVDWSAQQALGTGAFWLMSLTIAMRHLVTGSVAVHLLPYLIERGMAAEAAATVLAIMAFTGAPGRIVFGWLGDRYDKRYIMAFCFVFQSVGLFLFVALPLSWGILLFLSLYAPTYSGVLPLIPAMQGEYFGRRNFGTISGLMSPIAMVGTVGGPVFAAYIFDTTGAYDLAFNLFALANLLSLISILTTRRPTLDPAPTA